MTNLPSRYASLFAPLILLLLLILPQLTQSSSIAGTETLIGIVGEDFVLLGADTSVSQSIALTASNLDKIAVIVDAKVEGTPTTVAAAAGNAADADRLLGILTAQAAMAEYEASVGADVEFMDSTTAAVSTAIADSGLSVQDVAHLARAEIAGRLRTAKPLRVCLLVAGMMKMSSSESADENTVAGRLIRPSMFLSEQVQKQIQRASSIPSLAADSSLATREPLPTTRLVPKLYWLDEYGSLQSIQYGAHGFASNFMLSILDDGFRPNMTRRQAIALLNSCFAQLRQRYVINSPQPPCIKCIDREGCRIILQ